MPGLRLHGGAFPTQHWCAQRCQLTYTGYVVTSDWGMARTSPVAEVRHSTHAGIGRSSEALPYTERQSIHHRISHACDISL